MIYCCSCDSLKDNSWTLWLAMNIQILSEARNTFKSVVKYISSIWISALLKETPDLTAVLKYLSLTIYWNNNLVGEWKEDAIETGPFVEIASSITLSAALDNRYYTLLGSYYVLQEQFEREFQSNKQTCLVLSLVRLTFWSTPFFPAVWLQSFTPAGNEISLFYFVYIS